MVSDNADPPSNQSDDFDEVSKGCILLEFKESEEVKSIIRSFVTVYDDLILTERVIEKLTYILDQYQEQPHLLDPHLEDTLNIILTIVRDERTPMKLIHLVSKCWYLVTKVRGYKVIIRYLPHEVADVEPVLRLLSLQNPTDCETWECRYCLLLWLSMVSMIPFDLSRLDSDLPTAGGDVRLPVMDRIFAVGKLYLQVSDKASDAAAYMLAKFLTRLDVKQRLTSAAVHWALSFVTVPSVTISTNETSMSGALSLLALLFKHGKREDVLGYASPVVRKLMDCSVNKSGNTVLRKLSVKLAQRTALVFLKQRVAAWRYQRGSRSLAQNLLGTVASAGPSGDTLSVSSDQDEEYDVPDEIEEIVDYLLQALKDKDRVVRWSAAKGIGRLSGRLPLELADEVLASVLQLFTFHEIQFAWHGGCLAVAELGRRGLLLPRRLPDVVPIVLKALLYDDKKGSFSIGADVRDAACYICWSFARAYEPRDILPHVNDIASALVSVTLFDREVNVRRAASAAFQENVGRQGIFPHGIDILTTCDYYTVGNKSHSYLTLSSTVARFSEYTQVLIAHLVELKIPHWDICIRELTAKALHSFTLKVPDLMSSSVLPKLISLACSVDMNTRHGALLSVGEVVLALAEISKLNHSTVARVLKAEDLLSIKDIVSKLKARKQLLGLGGELMKRALCAMIESLSLAQVPFHNDIVIGVWQELLDDSLLHTVSADVQTAALAALSPFAVEFYQGEELSAIRECIVVRYTGLLMQGAEHTRRGAALALGALPPALFYRGQLSRVINALLAVTRVSNSKTDSWAECRRDAIKAIVRICKQVTACKGGDVDSCICEANLPVIYEALFGCMGDYTMDSRGDIGACVREASMTALLELSFSVVMQESTLLEPHIVGRMISCIAQQACEKINRTRAHAGRVFARLLYHSPPLPCIPRHRELQLIFPKTEIEQINWLASHETFPRFVQMLSLPEYSYNVLLGLSISVGGITESLVKDSASALVSYLRSLSDKKSTLAEFCKTLLEVFRNNVKNDRVSLPVLKTVDRLLVSGLFELLTETDCTEFVSSVLRLARQELSNSGDPQKLMVGADVLCGLLQFHDVQPQAMHELIGMLSHKYPRVRKTTANKIYEALITYDVVDSERLDDVTAVLTDTDWDDTKESIRPKIVQLRDLLNLQLPAVVKKDSTLKTVPM